MEDGTEREKQKNMSLVPSQRGRLLSSIYVRVGTWLGLVRAQRGIRAMNEVREQ